MKMRTLKHRNTRKISIAKAAAPIKVVSFSVYRKKDDVLVATVATEAEALALVTKAKTAKKASLYFA